MAKCEAERKLEEGIEDLLSQSEGVSTKEMSEEELALQELKDLKFKKQLAKYVESIIESRRVCEMMAEALYDTEYRLSGKVSSDEFLGLIEGISAKASR
ncbi:MAG: hypothetical protein ACP5NE_03205 [Candidatus Micrarchaeia archaeon]